MNYAGYERLYAEAKNLISEYGPIEDGGKLNVNNNGLSSTHIQRVRKIICEVNREIEIEAAYLVIEVFGNTVWGYTFTLKMILTLPKGTQ